MAGKLQAPFALDGSNGPAPQVRLNLVLSPHRNTLRLSRISRLPAGVARHAPHQEAHARDEVMGGKAKMQPGRRRPNRVTSAPGFSSPRGSSCRNASSIASRLSAGRAPMSRSRRAQFAPRSVGHAVNLLDMSDPPPLPDEAAVTLHELPNLDVRGIFMPSTIVRSRMRGSMMPA